MSTENWTFHSIDEDTFIERFRPRRNHLDLTASWDFGDGGCLFACAGKELQFVLKQDPRRVWTLVDGDEGQPVIETGLRYVNRLGYLVTEKPREPQQWYTVLCDCEIGDNPPDDCHSGRV